MNSNINSSGWWGKRNGPGKTVLLSERISCCKRMDGWHSYQSTSISFVPGFFCWLPFASPFPSVPCLAVGAWLAPPLWSFTSGVSPAAGFGLLITGLHTFSSSWWRGEERIDQNHQTLLLPVELSLSSAHLYFGNDVCYFNNGILRDAELALCIHPAVHPAHNFTHTFLNSAHFLCA